MKPTYEADPEFRALLRGEEPRSLERLALEISRDSSPNLEVEVYIARIDGMADQLRPRLHAGGAAVDAIRQINWLLYQELGFRGNEGEYGDPRNSLLHEVIDRRLGLPITLAVLYRAVAWRVGVRLAGVGLPAHFVLRTLPPDPEVFVDAFEGGRFLDRRGCIELVERRRGGAVVLREEDFEPSSARSIAGRILQNLRSASRAADEPGLLLAALERLHALSPSDPGVAIELANLARRFDDPGRALEVADDAIAAGAVLADLLRVRSLAARDLAARN